ncbi:MAG: cytochrome-c oxidase, cbb3-type subunit III [Pseudomonadota bacterium]
MSDDPKTKEPYVDEHTGVETTGHEWDGIRELNNPLPRWWLILFYVSIVWAIGYCIFMPTYPGWDGLRGHSERENVAMEIAEAHAERSAVATKLLSQLSMDEIEADPELFQFAMAAGKSAFGDNCATCHGPGGGGFEGYPNLADDVWLWGGSLADIKTTIRHGIRAHSDETRLSTMPSYGTHKLLTPQEINDLSYYVASLSQPSDGHHDAIARAKPVFEAQCAACHGNEGRGDRMFGAPDLTDQEWLYAGDVKSIRTQIYEGRNGTMPNWEGRLDETTITALAVYVHALGGGEPTLTASNEDAPSSKGSSGGE